MLFLYSYDLVPLITVAISFPSSCKINCLLFKSKAFVGYEFWKFLFLLKRDRFLRSANFISVKLKLSISIYNSHHLSLEIQFALHNGFIFLKWSSFLEQPVLIKPIFVIFANLPPFCRFVFCFQSITIMGVIWLTHTKIFIVFSDQLNI